MPSWLRRLFSLGSKGEATGRPDLQVLQDGPNGKEGGLACARSNLQVRPGKKTHRAPAGAASPRFGGDLLYATMGFRDSIEIAGRRREGAVGMAGGASKDGGQAGGPVVSGDKRGSHASTASQEVALQPILSQSQPARSAAAKGRRASAGAPPTAAGPVRGRASVKELETSMRCLLRDVGEIREGLEGLVDPGAAVRGRK